MVGFDCGSSALRHQVYPWRLGDDHSWISRKRSQKKIHKVILDWRLFGSKNGSAEQQWWESPGAGQQSQKRPGVTRGLARLVQITVSVNMLGPC